MSMLASDLNCLAVIITEDFYAQIAKGHTDAKRLRIGKVSIGVCGLLAIGVAYLLSKTSGGALSLYYAITAIVAGGLSGLFLLAFLNRKAGKTAALIGIAVNLIFTIWATLTMNGGKMLNLHQWNYPWHEFSIGAIGNLLLLFTGWMAALLICRKDKDTENVLTLWDWLARRRQDSQLNKNGEEE